MIDYLQGFLLQPNQPGFLQLLLVAPRHLHPVCHPPHGGGVCYVPCPVSTAAMSHSPRTDVPIFGDSLWPQAVGCKALKRTFFGGGRSIEVTCISSAQRAWEHTSCRATLWGHQQWLLEKLCVNN